MSHRDNCIIDTYEDAKKWLEMYRDTITDEQVNKVIRELELQIFSLDSELDAIAEGEE